MQPMQFCHMAPGGTSGLMILVSYTTLSFVSRLHFKKNKNIKLSCVICVPCLKLDWLIQIKFTVCDIMNNYVSSHKW